VPKEENNKPGHNGPQGKGMCASGGGDSETAAVTG
jgi:hypothetical protein